MATLTTSWETLTVQDFSFTYGYNYTFRQAIDGYYEQLNSTTARVHLRAWIENRNSVYGWDGSNKNWRLWGSSYDSGTRTDSAALPANFGRHLPDDNGVTVDVSAGSSFTVSYTYNVPIAGYSHTISVSVSVPTFATNPSGLSVSVSSRTYDSFTLAGSLTSWGTHTGSNQAFCLGVLVSNATSWSFGRLEWVNTNPGETKSFSGTVNNSSTPGDGGTTIKGASPYKVGVYARNGSGLYSWALNSSVQYTPPAPLTSVLFSNAGYTFTKRKVTFTATGSNSTKNSTNTVTFYYRYKKSTDSSYSSWISLGTGAATSSKTATIELDGSTTYNFQFKQTYQGQDSVVSTPNFTTPAVPAQGILYGSVNGKTKKITKLYGSVNGQSKEIVKLYGPVNGKAKRIY